MKKKERVHFIGICGTAMAPIAKMMKDMGFEVTGSDKGFFPPISLYLEKNKLNIELGYKKEHITRFIDFVVIGNAIAENNEEVMEVLRRKIPYYSYPEILKKYLIKDESIVIAGEYGKTTITSAVSFIFSKARLKPSFMFGGVSLNFKDAVKNDNGSGSNGSGSNGKISIIEGDEYNSAFYDKRSKFLHYRGKYVLITSLEWDHVDLFPTFDDYVASFKKLVQGIPKDGILFLNKDDKNIHHVVGSAKCKILYYSYMDNSVDLYIKEVTHKDGYTEFVTSDLLKYKTTLIGRHNLQNLVGAILVAKSFGIEYSTLEKSVFEFKGVKRRLEIRYEDDNVIIIDDFAHSQVKVKTSIDAVRENFKGSGPEGSGSEGSGSKNYRIIAVFEPDTMSSRSKKTLSWYKGIFNGADKVIVTDMYRSNSLEEGFSQDDLVNLIKEDGTDASYVSNQNISQFLYDNHRIDDVILFMSSRNFQGGIDKTVSLFKGSGSGS